MPPAPFAAWQPEQLNASKSFMPRCAAFSSSASGFLMLGATFTFPGTTPVTGTRNSSAAGIAPLYIVGCGGAGRGFCSGFVWPFAGGAGDFSNGGVGASVAAPPAMSAAMIAATPNAASDLPRAMLSSLASRAGRSFHHRDAVAAQKVPNGRPFMGNDLVQPGPQIGISFPHAKRDGILKHCGSESPGVGDQRNVQRRGCAGRVISAERPPNRGEIHFARCNVIDQ